MKKKNIKMYNLILMEMKNNSKVTEVYLAEKYFCSERTIRRYIKELKTVNKIKLIKNGREKEWIILL